MRVRQKHSTQVSKLNRRIGRKQVLKARERQIGENQEDALIAELTYREKARWKKLPEWKRQRILEKIGNDLASGNQEITDTDQTNKGNDPDSYGNQREHQNNSRNGGERREQNAPFFNSSKELKKYSLRDLSDDAFQNREEENEETEREEEGEVRQSGRLGDSFISSQNPDTHTESGIVKPSETKNVNGQERNRINPVQEQENESRFSRPSKRRYLGSKRKNKLIRLIEKNNSLIRGIESSFTNRQDVSQKADQVTKKMGESLGRVVGKNLAKGMAAIIKAAAAAISAAFGSVAGIILIPILLIVMLMFILTIGGSSGVGRANVSAECEKYRPLVVEYAKKYEVEDFVEIILCIMMQESAGRVPDVMQCSECPFNTKYPQRPNSIPDPEYSIDVGIQNFKECLREAGCTEVTDLDGLKLALQTYNYGNGYASWAKTGYGGYSPENAKLFSTIWASKYGWSQYGDPEYVPHVLRYYVVSGGFLPDDISNQEAVQQLEMLTPSWPAMMDERRGAVIAKGASLIGFTTYDMYGEDTRSGVDHPRTLDCSSFVAWAFQKSGFTDVPYWSTTGTFVTSANFSQISAADLVPGDIGLINQIPAGGANHVGIYVGKDNHGSGMWLHCTSHATAGCSTVTDGPRISYYPAFTIFYRYTGFS